MILHTSHPNAWGDVLVLLGVAAALKLLIGWYWFEFRVLRWRRWFLRRWRNRMESMARIPFHPALLSPGERAWLVGHGGVDSEQWWRAVVAEFRTGARDTAPTCAQYLAEFGRHPRVRPERRV